MNLLWTLPLRSGYLDNYVTAMVEVLVEDKVKPFNEKHKEKYSYNFVVIFGCYQMGQQTKQ